MPLVGSFDAALNNWYTLAWICKKQPAYRNHRRNSGVPDIIARDSAAYKAYEGANKNTHQQPKQTFKEVFWNKFF